ncbi:tetratricopeptide repeat protein [Chryseobacterium sp. MMS23-Vi53]|uniref:tetratricopeptide repeat protein n=1 Tax=Chryseobacterium sp. MMS23-Vi53 TaxID=3386644 RepID=UPI0039EB4F73
MKKYFLFIILFSSEVVFGCLNYSVIGTDIHGKKISTEYSLRHNNAFYITEIDVENYRRMASDDLKEYEKTKDIDRYLDYATSLVYLGKYDKAIKIFKEIELKNADKYEVFSNLGTAYELSGDNENALKYISKALAINKESHHGSEWIHIKILEYKLGRITLENLLGSNFGNNEIPETKLSDEELDKFVEDLSYQLSERTQFVKPTNEIVGKLYFELGNALALHSNSDVENTLEAYEFAKKYGYSNKLLEKRFTYFQNLVKQNPDSGKKIEGTDSVKVEKILNENKNVTVTASKSTSCSYWIIGGIAVLLSFILIFYLKKNKK